MESGMSLCIEDGALGKIQQIISGNEYKSQNLIFNNQVPVVTFSITDVKCFGGNTGAIDVTVNGASGTVSYLWSDGTNTEDRTGLPAGTYNVTISDDNGSIPHTITVNQPSVLTANVSSINATCNGANDGKIITSTSGGTGTISYSINPNIGSQSPAGTFNNLPAQDYIITSTDQNSCVQSTSVSVGTTDSTPPTFTVPNNITIYTDNSCNYNALPVITGLPANLADNCALGATQATYSDGPRIYGACAGTSSIIRTWSLTDAHGNTTTHQQTIAIADNIKPVLTVPSTKNIECNASILPANTGQATATDNCGGTPTITYSDVNVPGSCAGSSTITRTWTAADCSGNSSSGTQIISLQDIQPPVLTCTSFSVANPNAIPSSDSYVNISAIDNCGGAVNLILTSEEYTGLTGAPGFCPTSVIRKYIARDQCGNTSAECTQVITVLDLSGCAVCQSTVPFFGVNLEGAPDSLWTSPSVARKDICCGAKGPPPPRCISFNVYLDKDAVGLIFKITKGAIPGGALYYQIDCGPPQKVGEVLCLAGGRFYTLTFCEPGNNENTYTIESISGIIGVTGLITRQDAKCADTLTVSGIDPASVIWRVKSPNDQTLLRYLSFTNCLAPIFTPDKFTPPTIVYEVCGTLLGSNRCNDNPITDCNDVVVTTLPAITIAFDVDLGNICANNLPTINATVSPINPFYTYQWFSGSDGTGPFLSSDPFWKPSSEGAYSLVVTENQSGVRCNSATYNFSISFDVLAPVILAPPAPIVVECDDPGAIQKIVNWLATASATDGMTSIPVTNNYNGITMACNQPPVTVTFSASDQCGNVSSTTSTISVTDNKAPVITCPANATGTTDLSECFTKNVSLGTATATDNCSTPVISNNAPAQFPVGTTIVTWTATDACGNTATCNQTVTISDSNQPPTIICPADVVQTAQPGNCSLNNVTIPDPVTADNCGIVLQTWMIMNPDNTTRNSPSTGINWVSGETFNVGVSVVSYSVADAAGNTAGCQFNVLIKDLVKPEFSSGCPSDVTIAADPGLCTAFVTVPAPVVSDPCNEGYTVVNSFNSTNNASGTYPIGVTTVIWTVTDVSGNISTCSQIVTVTDLLPVLTCPGNTNVHADFQQPFASNVSVPAPTYSDNCPDLTLSWVMTGATNGSSQLTGVNIIPTLQYF